MHHYSKTELECFRAGKMMFLSRTLCRFHLWHCAECRQLLEEMDTDELLLTDLRQNQTDEKTGNGENTYKRLCEHFKTVPGSTI